MIGLLKLAVYVLCAVTSGICVALLTKGFLRSGSRLLLWTAVCFFFLAIHSVLVLIELMFLPSMDLQMFRHVASFAAGVSLVAGLVWESD